jgi:hypothetical protein
MTRVLRRLVSPEWRLRAHRLSRVRWVTKYRLMRDLNADVGVRRKLAYVLLDPEIESFSFELENESEIITALAAALGYPKEELAGYAFETHTDPELNERLSKHVRWRGDVKRRLPIGGRLVWYVIARATKPQVVVETGIYLGLGSLVMLRALERNAQEGSPGELLSFDTSISAGSVVREQARGDWQQFAGSTHDLLLGALKDRRVGMLVQDTPHTEDNQRFEFGAALAHAAPYLVLIDCSLGHARLLEAICHERGGGFHRIPLRSREHIFPGGEMGFAVFRSRR